MIGQNSLLNRSYERNTHINAVCVNGLADEILCYTLEIGAPTWEKFTSQLYNREIRVFTLIASNILVAIRTLRRKVAPGDRMAQGYRDD